MNNLLDLASNQQDIWLDQSGFPKSPLYNIGGTLTIKGKVDYKCLSEAIQYLANESDALRMTITSQPPIKQKLLDKLTFELEFIDFSLRSSPEEKAQQWLDNNFKQPFELNKNDLLWHFALIKENEHRYYLMTKYHHLIADGWSTTVVIARLAEIYNALLKNNPIKKKLSFCYSDFIKQEQKYINSSAYQSDDKYWRNILPKVPSTLITPRYPTTSNNPLPKAHIHKFKIKRKFYDEINTFSFHNKSTAYHTFLTALAIYFSRIYQRKEILIGVPSLNRSGARYKDVLGMFISMSPLVLSVSQSKNTNHILQNCTNRLRELYRHRRFPLADTCKRLKLLQSGQNTLFDIVLSYEKHDYSAAYGTASVIAKQQFSGVARFPLAVTICEFSNVDDVEVIFEGAENCFTAEDLQFLADHMLLILQQMLNEPNKPVSAINLLTLHDKKIIFDSFNQKKSMHEDMPSVIELFQQQVKTQANKTAIEFTNLKVSYQQLDQSSSQLAHHLLNQGIKANDIIAICLPRSIEMIIAILAILKSSAAYLPIPTDIPDKRINNILKQSQCSILLTLSKNQVRLSNSETQIICIDDYPATSIQQIRDIQINPNNIAYVIFTSGSSGQPKGVMIDHKALSLRLNWLQSLFKLTPSDRMAQTIQYNFDPSIIEIFLSLTQGASLILTPENSYTPDGFSQFIIDKQVTTLAMVPSSVRMFLQGLKDDQKTKLRLVCCGGEKLEPDLAQQFLQQTKAILFNVYGPTETTIVASAWRYTSDFSGKALPIGSPAENTQIYITDKHLKLLPANIEGEIIIAGDTLAKGYLNQPILTTSSFPAWSHSHARIYKTGDMGYIGHDGLLYFCGRVDRQVKISGYRIELGEIESVLQTHNDIDNAAVTTKITERFNGIYAYIESKRKDTDTLIDELSLLLRQQLPDYMQPNSIIPLKTIAISHTGKVDYSLLPAPNFTVNANYNQPPRNKLETQLQQLWFKTLSLKDIGMHDNFFELGGNSLSAISLLVAIEQLTGTRHPLSFLLEHTSIAKQAQALNKNSTETEQDSLITLSNHKNATPLFIAASGTGDLLRFSKLAKSLEDYCSLHMLLPPETKNNKQSIHSIAQCYADNIINNCNTTYYISGFSIGGITALETARILIAKGHPPEGVILLDSIYPRWPLQSPVLFKLIKYVSRLCKLDKKIINNRRLETMLSDPGITSQLEALPKHRIQPVKLPVALILTKGMWMFHPLLFSSWSRLFKNHLTQYLVSGLHGEMFQHPHSQQLALIIKKIIQA